MNTIVLLFILFINSAAAMDHIHCIFFGDICRNVWDLADPTSQDRLDPITEKTETNRLDLFSKANAISCYMGLLYMGNVPKNPLLFRFIPPPIFKKGEC